MQACHIFQQGSQLHLLRCHSTICGQQRKTLCNVAQGVDLLDRRVGVSLESVGKILRAICPCALQMLGAEPHRGQRVFDFMRHLLGHFAPCAFALQERPGLHALLKLVKQGVVRLHKGAHLVLPPRLQDDALPSVQRIGCHVFGKALQRPHNRIGQRKGQKPHKQEQHQIDGRQTAQKHPPIRLGRHAWVVMHMTQGQQVTLLRGQGPHHFRPGGPVRKDRPLAAVARLSQNLVR